MPVAFVFASTEPGRAAEVLEAINNFGDQLEAKIRGAWEVYGAYDVILKIEGENKDVIRRVVSRTIRKLNGVRSTLTMLVVEK